MSVNNIDISSHRFHLIKMLNIKEIDTNDNVITVVHLFNY